MKKNLIDIQGITYKQVPGFSEYWISKEGDVIRIYKPKIHLSNKNYPVVKFRQKALLLHRMVALTWIPNPHNYPVVAHKNDNRLDYSVDNLEWCTQQYNASQASKRARMKAKNRIWKYYHEAKTLFDQGKTRNWVSKKLHVGVRTAQKFYDRYLSESKEKKTHR